MNLENQDIYLISFGLFLFFLTIFLVARQISNRNKIPLKIDGNSEVVLEQSQIDLINRKLLASIYFLLMVHHLVLSN